MSVDFYLQDQTYWNNLRIPRLGIANMNFAVLQELLKLPGTDYTGQISADELLDKIAQARTELQRHGQEWERPEEPPPARQEGQSLIILRTPALDQEDLWNYLDRLQQVALFAKAKGTGVLWS